MLALFYFCFFFNDTATTEIYTLSLHDALPIYVQDRDGKPSGVVVASSGFEQNESDGWKVLENDQMIVASNRTGEYHVRSI